MDRVQLVEDLTPFCDIGTEAPEVRMRGGKLVAKFTRDGRAYKASIDVQTSKVQLNIESGQPRYYASVSQMLAADHFGNLRRWADAQRDYLRKVALPAGELMPIRGRVHAGAQVSSVEELDSLVGQPRNAADATEVVLLDGPAGIGKSTLIEQLAVVRSNNYRTSAKPLILHVKSRGRVLSNLQDLMAFSLQTLRLQITYDQVPVLVRHGLVVLAIDGFDELGDPSGYELAWAQVNDLVTSIRGKGTMILAGRETFIGRERLLRDVKSLRPDADIVTEVELESPTPSQAKEWLKRTGSWSEASFGLPAVSVLLEQDSYALRPVFLRLLKDLKPKELREKSETDLTALLVNHMVKREAKKFGAPVEKAMTLSGIEAFVQAFLREVARDMADSETESVDTNALGWLAEAALGDGWSGETQRLIKNRIGVVAFLCEDDRPGHRRFSHAQIMNYFLSHVTLETISRGEFPKYVRRNLFGPEFLLAFGDVVMERAAEADENVNEFFFEATSALRSRGFMDRTPRNIGALLWAALPAAGTADKIEVGGFHVDEAVIRRTAPRGLLRNMVVNQLDARGADLAELSFDSVVIVRLIADESTRVGVGFPDVGRLMLSGDDVTSEEAIKKWLDKHGRQIASEDLDNGIPEKLKRHPAYSLLGRACRQRQYWLRSEGDFHAARILNDDWWPVVADALRKHGFLREEVDKQASGRSSTFFHIKQGSRVLSENLDDPEVKGVYQDLATTLLKSSQ